MAEELQGQRVSGYGEASTGEGFLPGCYWKTTSGWLCVTPNGHLGNLDSHEVTEHDDGTITVSPSILVALPPDNREVWHGFLERGVWRSV